MNPKYTAFMLGSEAELAKKFALKPDDTDILVTYVPPKGIFDLTRRGERVGSESSAYELG